MAGRGVEGDAHSGETVKHRSRVVQDPNQPNLRQVHLIPAELFDDLRAGGFEVSAGQMGENVTTRGVDLLGLPPGARLHLGVAAVVEVTGLRNPCAQLDGLQTGLMAATLGRDAPCARERVSRRCSLVPMAALRGAERVFSGSWEGLWSAVKVQMLPCNLCQATGPVALLPKKPIRFPTFG